ncbi:MAG: serine/threonine-protein kinase [Nostoc sp. S4]|nr:serine/threonine-protein kinase [Nostoc sp. S4]
MNSELHKKLDNRYIIIKLLGSGGFGDTYLAEDQRLQGRKCVVKKFNPKNVIPEFLDELKKRFRKEAKFLFLFDGRDQIPKITDFFEENGELYLVQDFIVGHELSQEIETPLSEKKVIEILQSILEALEFVHQENIIHRDIKPQNLMRRQRDNKIVIIDFGIAKLIDDMTIKGSPQGLKSPTICIGTRGYMPSEQNDGNPQLSSDIYAVGMIGIQALTKISPQVLDSDSKIHEILWQNKVSKELARILEKMVRRDYNQRYQNATQALKALKSLNTKHVFSFPLPLLLPGVLGIFALLAILLPSKKQTVITLPQPPITSTPVTTPTTIITPTPPMYKEIGDEAYSQWLESKDDNGRSAEFKIAILSIGYRWKIGEVNLVEDKNQIIPLTQFKSKLDQRGEIYNQMNNPTKIISVGTASCEQVPDEQDPLRLEEARALERAKQLQKVVAKELFDIGEYRLLNLGQFKDYCERHPHKTSLQRSIIIIAVRKESPGVILDQALRNKFQQELNQSKNQIQGYTINLDKYSLGSKDKFRLITDNTP